MRRISTATRVADKFGAGKAGFTDGDVVGGVAATDLEAVWFDHIQEEMAGVIEAAGIALNGAVLTQLLQALQSGAGFTKPPASRNGVSGFQALPGGLILQWISSSTLAVGAQLLTLPMAFPNGKVGVLASQGSSAISSTSAVGASIGGGTLGQINVFSGQGSNTGYFWVLGW